MDRQTGGASPHRPGSRHAAQIVEILDFECCESNRTSTNHAGMTIGDIDFFEYHNLQIYAALATNQWGLRALLAGGWQQGAISRPHSDGDIGSRENGGATASIAVEGHSFRPRENQLIERTGH
jgi:hypothetical protein